MPLFRSHRRRRDAGGEAAAHARCGLRRLAALALAASTFGGGLNAADTAPDFKPEDISIGEPISLPFATPLASPTAGRAPIAPTGPQAGGSLAPSAAEMPSVITPAAPAPPRNLPPQPPADAGISSEPAAPSAEAGTGWLGIAVDDTVVTGRLVVVEVAPEGPAARAGVRRQDMLLAIDGNHLQNGDELAAALAAIAPGQRVRMALGRDNRVEDVVAQASPRPPEALARDWQSATTAQPAPPQATVPAQAGVPGVAAAPPLAAPTHLVQETAAIGVLPAPMPVAAAPQAAAPQTAPPRSLAPPADRTTGDPSQVPRSIMANPSPPGRTALGVRTVPVDPNVQSRFRLPEPQGAFVIGVVQDLPASKAGVPPGSVIVAINNQPVRSPHDLTHLVARGPVGTPVPLHYVLPGGQSKQAEVVLQSLEQPLERALVGTNDAAQAVDPPALQPAPQTSRRVQPTAGYESAEAAPLLRLEELLRRVNNRLEQLERRLERMEPGR